MKITLTLQKKEIKLNLCQGILREALEMDEANALQQSNENYDASVKLSSKEKK